MRRFRCVVCGAPVQKVFRQDGEASFGDCHRCEMIRPLERVVPVNPNERGPGRRGNRGAAGRRGGSDVAPETPYLKMTELPAQCWCGGRFILVPKVEVRQGLTRSCGKRGCEPTIAA